MLCSGRCYTDEPIRTDSYHVPTSPTYSAPAVEQEPRAAKDESVKESKGYVLDPSCFEAVGLAVEDGTVTHALGDEHAQAILDGTITFEDARAQQRAVKEKLHRMP